MTSQKNAISRLFVKLYSKTRWETLRHEVTVGRMSSSAPWKKNNMLSLVRAATCFNSAVCSSAATTYTAFHAQNWVLHTRTHIHTYTHTHTSTHARTHTHTRTHTHIHTHGCSLARPLCDSTGAYRHHTFAIHINYIYVCMYVYTYVCMYVYIYGLRRCGAYMRLYVYMYIHMYICMYVYMCICMHVCKYEYKYIRMHVCMYVCMHVCMHVCMYACMYACMHACMCVYIYIYIHTYICVYTYIELNKCIPPPYRRR
jgi:hypothetical protein